MTTNKIFICHSSIDKKFVEKLANDLLDYGVDVWFDKWEIKVGDSIVDKINTGILESSYMGIVLSPNSLKSEWVKKELNGGLLIEIKSKKVVVLPILFQSCSIPPLLSDKKYADFTNSYQNGFSDLLNRFSIPFTHKKTKDEIKGHLYIDNTKNNIIENNFIENNFFENK